MANVNINVNASAVSYKYVQICNFSEAARFWIRAGVSDRRSPYLVDGETVVALQLAFSLHMMGRKPAEMLQSVSCPTPASREPSLLEYQATTAPLE